MQKWIKTLSQTQIWLMTFWEFSFALFTVKVWIIHENVITFFCIFLLKMNILLYYLYFPQVFTILSLPWIHQPPWTTNLKLLVHLKIVFHSSYLIYYALKQHLFHFLSIFIQKIKDFDSKLFKVHRAIQAQDSWSLTSGSLSCWTSLCLLKLSIHWLNVWN